MLFSILIAHYNNYDYFTECYQSILKQTHQNFEIILVDDCSTDDSLEKIIKLTENEHRIKIYKNKENKGVGYTKRKCVELATGDICGFVDPDDAIVENALECCLEQYKNQDIVATHSQLLMCDSNLKSSYIFPNTKAIKNGKPMFFNILYEVNHFFTFKISAYDKTYGINPELSSAVDQDLYLKLYEIGEFKYIQEPLYLYRLHEKGVSQEKSKKDKLNENWHKVLEDTIKRRNIKKLYGKKIIEIDNLPKFIFEKENTPLKKLLRKLS